MKFRQHSQAVIKNAGIGYNRNGCEESRLHFKRLPKKIWCSAKKNQLLAINA
jgi:hypothetical protein